MSQGTLKWTPNAPPPTAPDWFEFISGVLNPFRSLENLSQMLHHKTAFMPSTEFIIRNSQSPHLKLYPVVQKMINPISLRSLIKPPWKPEVHLKYKVNMSKPILQMVSGDHQHEYQIRGVCIMAYIIMSYKVKVIKITSVCLYASLMYHTLYTKF